MRGEKLKEGGGFGKEKRAERNLKIQQAIFRENPKSKFQWEVTKRLPEWIQKNQGKKIRLALTPTLSPKEKELHALGHGFCKQVIPLGLRRIQLIIAARSNASGG